MTDFQELYRQAFENLDRPLTSSDKISEQEITSAEDKLGIRASKALTDFYQVAGRAEDYTCVFNRLLPLNEWDIDSGKLIFMEENQVVVLWGADISSGQSDDPPVFQAQNNDAMAWEQVSERCSTFLLVMLHWEAAFGGAIPYTSTAVVSKDLVTVLDQNWSFIGEVNLMRAYAKSGAAICFVQWDQDWRIFAGASTKERLDAIALELSIQWDEVV